MRLKLPRTPWWWHPFTFMGEGDSSVMFAAGFKLRYREDGRSMLVDHEIQADPRDVVIDRDSIKSWEPPHDEDPIDEADRDRIIENMRRAFATRNYKLSVFDDPPAYRWPKLPETALPVTAATATQFAIALFEYLAHDESIAGPTSCNPAVGEAGTPNAGTSIWRVELPAAVLTRSSRETRRTLWVIELNQATGYPTVVEHPLDA